MKKNGKRREGVPLSSRGITDILPFNLHSKPPAFSLGKQNSDEANVRTNSIYQISRKRRNLGERVVRKDSHNPLSLQS